ncbi:amino acid adenylation domain-containing protein [Zooshikella marina]|uniref:non-ribosomal peptide synthetase n=1 Tax=Zooshikella ganghwensis TaxID=202772 RepID=UPI001BAEC509|nr:non-ribosomal peptide synthetase [Zooshikella ganghwensis]MBU2705621.1 amino acid adenylation domain-containing protein [Zooshikella ganghwensis]
MDSLVSVLRNRAYNNSTDEAYTFIADQYELDKCMSYQELDQSALSIAEVLLSAGLKGKRMLLLYPPSSEYIEAFIGCLYANVIAVPVYSTDESRLDKQLERLSAIIDDSDVSGILTTSTLSEQTRRVVDSIVSTNTLKWINTDLIQRVASNNFNLPVISGNDIAFLQYTSGSTHLPKGVILTHNNLLHNLSCIFNHFEVATNTRVVSWLPPYHDMGLIGAILTPLFGGVPVTLMSPRYFLQAPLRWLSIISQYKNVISGGPNFAYELCLRAFMRRKPDNLLNLHEWKIAFCGAEPIRPETMRRFCGTFAPFGFDTHAFSSCYGLAENTLIVSGSGRDCGTRILTVDNSSYQSKIIQPVDQSTLSKSLVSCGRVVSGIQVAIVDPTQHKRLSDHMIGEIWVKGQSVAKGYWRNNKSAETFSARLDNESNLTNETEENDTGWLRTGDLGFFDRDELFVTGRLKDLLVIRGKNFYPQDIEYVVENSHPALRPASTSVFTVDSDLGEQLVVVQELARKYHGKNYLPQRTDVMMSIRTAVAEKIGLSIYQLVLIEAGTIPKTSSGKIRRSACKQRFLENKLVTLASERQPEKLINSNMVNIDRPINNQFSENWGESYSTLLCNVTKHCEIDISQIKQTMTLFNLGFDSVSLLWLQHDLEQAFQCEVPLRLLLKKQSLGTLSLEIDVLLSDKAFTSNYADKTAIISGATTHLLSSSLYQSTEMQRSFWFLNQLEPTSTAYIVARAVKINGVFSKQALKQALNDLLSAHTALRSRYVVENGEPLFSYLWPARVDLINVDVTGLSEERIREIVTQKAYEPFDLENDYLIRPVLFSRSMQQTIFLLSCHHSIIDFWSMALFLRDFCQQYNYYNSIRSQHDDPKYRPSLKGSDFSIFSQYYNQYFLREQDWSYWQTQLKGKLPKLRLPEAQESTLPANNTPFSARKSALCCKFEIDEVLHQRLNDYADQQGTTPYVVLLTVYSVLLHRYSGDQEFVIGSPVVNRTFPGSAEIIGCCVNTLPLRIKINTSLSTTELMQGVQSVVTEGLKHQAFPLPKMIERLAIHRDGAHTPLFQTLFNYLPGNSTSLNALSALAMGEPTVDNAILLGSAELTAFPLPPADPQFLLSLTVAAKPFSQTKQSDNSLAQVANGLWCVFDYDQSQLSASTVQRYAKQFIDLLRVWLDHTGGLQDLPWLSAAEYAHYEHLRLTEWNNTKTVEASTEHHLPALFMQQVEKTPDSLALTVGQAEFTYLQLRQHANQVTAHLLALGLSAESKVGLFTARDQHLIFALLGVLQAGLVYVPIDPSYPASRISYILEVGEVDVVLASANLLSQLPDVSCPVIEIETLTNSGGVSEYPNIQINPDQLCYVLFTSGSTGQPKGVSISHQNAANLVRWAGLEFTEEALSGVLASTSVCFDLSIFEIFVPLCHGGRVILVENALQLPSLPPTLNVTLINTVPSAIASLLSQQAIPGSVQVINLAGEPLRASLVRRLYQETDVTQVINLYGPSETTTYSTMAKLSAQVCEPVAIGLPIANTALYVLDESLNEVPVGMVGELYIGGLGVARGYYAQPGVTAERFIPDPFQHESTGSRLYRTGDLVRRGDDDLLRYIGRTDHQVKLRGYRIELGEIESLLCQYSEVSNAVVLVSEGSDDQRYLVGFVVSTVNPSQSLQQDGQWLRALRTYLGRYLPEYMIPSQFVAVDELPLTPNGKVDRQQLAQQIPLLTDHLVAQGNKSAYQPPTTPLELKLHAIWQELLSSNSYVPLGLNQAASKEHAQQLPHLRIGIHDDFFLLGGNSLLAVKLAGRVNEQLGTKLSVKELFSAPTIAQQAGLLTSTKKQGQQVTTPIKAQPRVTYSKQ